MYSNHRTLKVKYLSSWPRWLHGLRLRSAAAFRDLGFESRWGAWMSLCCECCVLSGSGLCDGPISSRRVLPSVCVCVCVCVCHWVWSDATVTLYTYNDYVEEMTYNVTWRRVRVTIVAVESSEYYTTWESVCNLSYPACNTHAPYCHLWPAPIYNIFPHYLINDTIFEKNTYHKMCCDFL